MTKITRGIFLIFLLLTACQKEISENQAEYFIKFYGSFLDDEGYDVQPTSDGGYVIVGSSERVGSKKDIILIRVDKYGNQLSWSPKYFGDLGDDAAYSVRVLDDGSFIIAGYVTSGIGEKANKDAVLIRTDASGELIWQSKFGGSSDDEAKSVVAKESGGFIFVGYSGNAANLKQIYLVNVDDGGHFISSTIRPFAGEELSSIIRLSDGNFLVAGTKYASLGAIDNPESQILILVLNEVGNDLDNYTFGEADRSETVSGTFPSLDGNFFIIGTIATQDGKHKDILIKKLARRKIIWEKTISADGFLEGKAVCEMDDGSLILIADKTDDFAMKAEKKIELYFLDAQGEVLSSKEYGASGDQSAEAVNYLNGRIVILGRNTNSIDVNSMITLIKTDREGNLWN